jgi:16S rRNA processing protein RimM
MTTPLAEWASLALIRRPQGRRGEVFADLLTDFPEKFSDRKQLWLVAEQDSSARVPPPREVTLSAHWLHKGGVVLHFAGVDSITAAEELKGFVVAIPRANRVRLDEGEAYIADLVGCTLIDVDGASQAAVGVIDDVDRTSGPVALLVVHRDGKEILVPFAKSYLRRIDLESKRVEMSLPDGLVDLNS